MRKIQVEICTGTACFVMGASELMLLEEKLPESLQDKVEITGSPCMGNCHSERKSHLPFVKIDGEVIEDANLPDVIERIEKIAEGNKNA
ncbi:MAG: (2Fe-2S) ferredoxin domain-containing protein [Treponema sp.]